MNGGNYSLNVYPRTVLNKHCFCKDGVTLLLQATNYKTKGRLSKLVSLISSHLPGVTHLRGSLGGNNSDVYS